MASASTGLGLLIVLAGLAAPAESTVASPEQLRQLVQRLGHPEYAVRQHAQDQLARLGFQAFEALEEAADSPDLEVARRAQMLLRELRQHYERPEDPPAVKNLLAV